jgi:hypothetical protein
MLRIKDRDPILAAVIVDNIVFDGGKNVRLFVVGSVIDSLSSSCFALLFVYARCSLVHTVG